MRYSLCARIGFLFSFPFSCLKRFPSLFLTVPLSFLLSCRDMKEGDSRSVLGGTWESECVASSGIMPFAQVQYRFADDHSVTRSEKFYLDSSCQNLLGEIVHRGEFALEVRSELNVYNIDMFMTAVEATPKSTSAVELWMTGVSSSVKMS
jgi:hypothetical protein